MTKEEKIKVAKWYICNYLIGLDTETYNLVKNDKINNLDELEEIIKKKRRKRSAIVSQMPTCNQ